MRLYIYKKRAEIRMEDWKWAFLAHYLKTEKMTLLQFVEKVEATAWHIRHKYDAGMLFRVEVKRTMERYRDRARNVAIQRFPEECRGFISPVANAIREKLAQRKRKGIRINWGWHSDYMQRFYARKVWPAVNGQKIGGIATWQEADKSLRAKDQSYMTDGVNRWG